VALFDISWRDTRCLHIVIAPFNRTLRQSRFGCEPPRSRQARYPQPIRSQIKRGTAAARSTIVPLLF
jgi:hypothetical protein